MKKARPGGEVPAGPRSRKPGILELTQTRNDSALSGAIISSRLVGTMNLRGQSVGKYLDSLLHSSIRRDIGLMCLTETHCAALDGVTLTSEFDNCGHEWTLILSGDTSNTKRGAGFLVDPRYEIVETKFYSARVGLLIYKLRKDKFWDAVTGAPDCGARRPSFGLLSCYAPTETQATQHELDVFYRNIDMAFAYAKNSCGHFPVLAGDLNVDVGEHVADGNLPACVTGPRVAGRKSSPNCSDLFAFASKRDYVIANTFGRATSVKAKNARDRSKNLTQTREREKSDFTWFHPRTGRGHIKDLILVPREELESLTEVWVDHGANAGSNDHSLVVMGLRGLKQPKWRRRALLNYVGTWRLQNSKLGLRVPSHGRLHSGARKSGKEQKAGTTPRPGKRMTALEFRAVKDTRRYELKQELKRLLDIQNSNGNSPIECEWTTTVETFKRACTKTLSKKMDQEPLPRSWREVKGCQIGSIWDKAARYRKLTRRDPDNISHKANLIATRSRAKREKLRCQRVWKRTLSEVVEKDRNAGRKREAKLLLVGRFTNQSTGDGPSPEGFKDHFTKLFGKESEKETLELNSSTDLKQKAEPQNAYSGPPSSAEITRAIKNLSSGKASGADGLPAEFYKLGAEVVTEQLVKEFDALWPRQVRMAGKDDELQWNLKPIPKAWQDASCVTLFKKGDKKDPGNYRGIFLLDVAGKILTSVIAERISKIADPWLRDEQCGFRKRRGTTQQIFALRRLQEEAMRADKPLCAVFIDFKKAFDSPPRSAIWESLRHIGVPEDVVAMCVAIHEDPEGKILGGTGRNTFKIRRGVRQGCTLGPILFNILLEFCLRKANLNGGGIEMGCVDKAGLPCPAELRGSRFVFTEGGYADDLYFVAGTTTELEGILAKLDAVCAPIGLDISAGKTEWLWLSKTRGDNEEDGESATVSFRNALIKRVDQFNYLGSTISEEGGIDSAVADRLQNAKVKLNEIRQGWTSCMPRWKKLKDVKSRVFPVLVYGSETWAVKQKHYNTLEVFLNKVRLAVIDRPRYFEGITMSNDDLHNRVCLPSAVELLLPRRLAFLLRLSGGACEIAKKSIWMEVQNPGKIISGVTVGHNPRVLRSELQYLRKYSEYLASKVAQEDSRHADVDVVWTAIKDYMRQYGKRAATALVARACQAGRLEVPSLKSAPTQNFKCSYADCHQAYSALKFLNRHVRIAHLPSSSEDPVVPDPNFETTNKAEVKASDTFNCNLCQKVYKKIGFLKRHLSTVHMVSETTPTLGQTPKEVPKVPASGIALSSEQVRAKIDLTQGLRCLICGKGASKGKSWGEKTLANHMAAEHKVNSRTGKTSRNRALKGGQAK